MLVRPKDPKEVRYFTRKTVGKGKVMIWVFNPDCPKCDGKLSIPYDEETGRYKSMARDVTCNKCIYSIPKKDFKEVEAVANIAYTCPYCGKEGELQLPFVNKKKKIFKFKCSHCGKEIKV